MIAKTFWLCRRRRWPAFVFVAVDADDDKWSIFEFGSQLQLMRHIGQTVSTGRIPENKQHNFAFLVAEFQVTALQVLASNVGGQLTGQQIWHVVQTNQSRVGTRANLGFGIGARYIRIIICRFGQVNFGLNLSFCPTLFREFTTPQ